MAKNEETRYWNIPVPKSLDDALETALTLKGTGQRRSSPEESSAENWRIWALSQRRSLPHMSLSTDVPDGATQRHSRMMELLTFVNLCEPRGETITQIQSHMLMGSLA